MKKIFRRAVLVVVLVLVLAIATLAAIGLPAPSAITTDHVPRVPWNHAIASVRVMQQALESIRFEVWDPADGGMLVRARHGMLESRLQHVDAPGGMPAFLGALPRDADDIRIHPDGDFVLYLLDSDGDENYQIWRWDRGTAEPIRMTAGTGRHNLGHVDPSGTLLAFASTVRNGTDYDLYIVDPTSADPAERVFEGTGYWQPGEWSPSGDAFLVLNYVSITESHLYSFDVASRTAIPIGAAGDGPAAYGGAAWSKDGSTVYFISDHDSEFRRLRALDLATGDIRVLSGGVDWDVESIAVAPDDSAVAALVNVDGVSTLYLADRSTGSMQAVESLPLGIPRGIEFHPENNVLAMSHTDLTGIARVLTYDVDTGTLEPWTHLDRVTVQDLPDPELVHFPTFDTVDGETREISAFLYPAADTGAGPGPVVVSIHGGPEGQARLGLNPVLDNLRRSGLTVIQPNVRGSSGYGKTFVKLDNGFLREDSVRDIGALLDWIETRPELDADRVAVFGGSYGGYMVLASLVHHGHRLRCGVDLFGISDFVTFLENTEDYRRDLRRVEYGDERDPAMREFLESISPLTHAAAIRTPLLVFQGATDPRVPVTESRQIVEKVRASGVEVRYIEAANEGHGLRNPMNGLYVGSAAASFVAECLAD